VTLREANRQVLHGLIEAFLDWQESEEADTEVGVAILVAEMRAPDGSASTPVFYSSDPRRWAQGGLFRTCLKAIGEDV
jgi:hypothetical protein